VVAELFPKSLIMKMLVRNSVEGRSETACRVYHRIFVLVNLILTKRSARYGRPETAKRGANQFQK